MTQAEVHEALKNARALIAERGLAKGTLQASDGRLCIRGALNHVVLGNPFWATPDPFGRITSLSHDFLKPCEQAMGFAGYPDGFDDNDAAEWNNVDERTLEEVLARFDEGIAATAQRDEELVAV